MSPGPGARGRDRGAGAAVRAARRPLLPELGQPARATGTPRSAAPSTRWRRSSSPQLPDMVAVRGHRLRQGQGRLRDAAGELRPAHRSSPTRTGSTTSSSSTSATSPTWTSSASARRSSRDIPDQAIATMVQGVDMELFRPDDELKKLAELAVELRPAAALRRHRRRRGHARPRSPRPPAADRWIAAVRGRPGPVVQLHRRQRLLRPRQVLERAPGDPARLHRGLHPPAATRARTSCARSRR